MGWDMQSGICEKRFLKLVKWVSEKVKLQVGMAGLATAWSIPVPKSALEISQFQPPES